MESGETVKNKKILLPIAICLPFVAMPILFLFSIFHVNEDQRCEKLTCTVTTFSGERSAREHLGALDLQVVEEAVLKSRTYSPEKSFNAEKEKEWMIGLHQFTETNEPVGNLFSPKEFSFKHIYELANGDLLLHGVCQRELRVIGAAEEHVISFRHIIDLDNEYFSMSKPHFFLRINREGQVKWLRGISAFEADSDGSYVLHVSQEGIVTMVGSYHQLNVRVGVGASNPHRIPSGDLGYIVVQFSNDGTLAACRKIGSGWVEFHALTTTQNNHVYLLGKGRQNTQFYLEEGIKEVPYRWFISEFTLE